MRLANRLLREQVQRHNDVGASMEKMVYARTEALERTKTELETKERRNRVMLESMSQVLLTTDPSGTITEKQESLERYTGQQWDEQKGYDTFSLLSFGRSTDSKEVWQSLVAKGETSVLYGKLYSEVHKAQRHIRATVAPVKDRDGFLVEWIVAIEDIEERLEAEKRFQRLFDLAPVSMAMQDENGTIILVNSAFEKMFGYDASELIGSSGALLASDRDEDTHIEDVRALLRSPNKIVFGDRADVFAKRKDGELFPLQATVQSIDWQGKPAVVATYIDLSINHERHVEILEAKNKELEVSNRDLEQFAYVASHDLKAPVRKISAFGAMLEEKAEGQLNDEAKQILDYMTNSAGRMSELIENLLSYARVSRESVQAESVDMNAVVGAVVDDLGLNEQVRDGELLVGDLPPVFGHEPHLRRLLSNLIVNARKFRQAEKDLLIKIEGESLSDGGKDMGCVIRVVDNGIGILEENLDQVFGMFTRMHGRNIEGTGLGLPICRRIMREQGGSIDVSSTVGEGTTFTLRFAPAEAAELKDASEQS